MSSYPPYNSPPFGGFPGQSYGADHIATIQRLMHQDSERVATIERLMQIEADRVATIKRLTDENARLADQTLTVLALDAERVNAIERMVQLDKDRVATIERAEKELHRLAGELHGVTRRFYETDGLIAMDRNTSFMEEPSFAKAWHKSKEANKEGWPEGVPDVRWRAAIAVWAAKNALHLKGDFVECGVHTGLFSLVVLHALGSQIAKRKFFLFDTFNGIPVKDLTGEELEHAEMANRHAYADVWEIAQRNFAPFKNAKLVKGELPGTLAKAGIGDIAYLLVDLNIAAPEKAVIEKLWDRVVPGAIIIIDDYGWTAAKAQYDMWNAFAAKVGHAIAPLPTGQGLLIKR